MVGLAWRLHQAFLMGDRLDEFEDLLGLVHRMGYRVLSVRQWIDRLEAGRAREARVLVLRHDVDTDPPTALRMAELEHGLGMQGSFYFRLGTFDDRVVRRLLEMGMDVGYHFEEIATFAKRHRLGCPRAVLARMPEIADAFVANLSALRARYGLPFDVVCSHGDWANRALRLPNHALLEDPALRARAGVSHEVYDAALVEPLAARFSDCDRPALWRPADPRAALQAGLSPVKILVHPSQWKASVRHNLLELATRSSEAIACAGWGRRP